MRLLQFLNLSLLCLFAVLAILFGVVVALLDSGHAGPQGSLTIMLQAAVISVGLALLAGLAWLGFRRGKRWRWPAEVLLVAVLASVGVLIT